jgi:hypothetical protein
MREAIPPLHQRSQLKKLKAQGQLYLYLLLKKYKVEN